MNTRSTDIDRDPRAATRQRLQERRAGRRGIVENDEPLGHAAQLGEAAAPIRRVHQHAQADDNVEFVIAKIECVRIPSKKAYFDTFLERPAAGDGQHRLGGINGGDMRAPARQEQGRAPGAGTDVENRASLNPADHVRQDPRLRSRHELADRTAETAVLEGARHTRIGIRGVAVVIPRPRFRHATSLTTATAAGGGISAAQACRVRSR